MKRQSSARHRGGETSTRTVPADETRAQVEAESNASPRTLSEKDVPRSDAPETRAVPDEAPSTGRDA